MTVPADSDRPEVGLVSANRALLSRGVLYTVATAVQLSAVVLVLPVVTRMMSAREFGQVATAIVITQLLGVVVGLGLPATVTREYFAGKADGLDRARRLTSAGLIVAVGLTAVVLLTGSWWSNVFSDMTFGRVLVLSCLAAVPVSVMTSTQATLRAQHRIVAFAGCAIGATVVGQTLGFLLLAVTDLGPAGYVAGLFVGWALGAVAGLLVTGARPWSLPTGSVLHEAFALGLPTIPHGLAVYVIAAGDRVLVERFEGLEAVGQYQIAYSVGAVVIVVLVALNNAWAPIVFGAPDHARWEVLARTTATVLRLVATAVAGLAIGAPLAFSLLAPNYDRVELSRVASVVALSAVPYALYLASVHVVFQVGRTGVLAWSTPLAAAVNVAANVALVPRFGLIGAAWATVASYVVWAALLRRASDQMAQVPWIHEAARSAVVFALVAVAIAFMLPTDGPWLLARSVLLLAAGVRLITIVRAGSAEAQTGERPRSSSDRIVVEEWTGLGPAGQ